MREALQVEIEAVGKPFEEISSKGQGTNSKRNVEYSGQAGGRGGEKKCCVKLNHHLLHQMQKSHLQRALARRGRA